jgi:regulator of sigma E protease
MLTTAVAFIVTIGVLIFVHELGHFMTAKAVGIEVQRFSIGFGPKILGFRRGETEYVISLLPLGGYVKMAGMEEMEMIEGGGSSASGTVDARPTEPVSPEQRSRDFESKPIWARTLVISAGVLMNLLFAFVVYTLIAMIWGVPRDPGTRLGGVSEDLVPPGAEALATIEPGWQLTAIGDEEVTSWREAQRALLTARAGEITFQFANAAPLTVNLPSNDTMRARLIGSFEPLVEVDPVIGTVVADGSAARAGMRAGDRVISADGQEISTWQQFVAIIERRPGQPVPLVVQRDSAQVALTVTPEARTNGELRFGRIGVAAPYRTIEDRLPREAAGPLTAIQRGAHQTWDMVTLTFDFLAGMITGRHSARNVGGPIMITQMSGEAARAGLQYLLGFMAVLSVNLAVLNLLPIPVLDGGHLVFLGVEAVRGRPLAIEQRIRLSQIGFIIIIGLMVWAFGNDIMRVFGI